MRFSLISAIATLGSVVMAQPVAPPASSQEVVNDLNVLTEKAHDLQEPAKKLSITNAHLLLIGTGPWTKTIHGNADISTTASTYSQQLTGTQQFSEKECTDITGTFRDFVSDNQAYLNILIGKARFISQVPFVGPPMEASLTAVEKSYDTLSIQIINLCPSTAQELSSEFKSLDETLTLAIKAYQPVGQN